MSLGVGFEDGSVLMIDPDNAIIKKTHKSHKYGLSRFGLLQGDGSGGTAFAVGNPDVSKDYCIRLWDLAQNRFNRIFRSHDSPITSTSAHSSRDALLSSADDGWSYLWDPREERPVWQYLGSKSSLAVFSPSVDSSDTFYVTDPVQKCIHIHDMRSAQQPTASLSNIVSKMDELVPTPDGTRLLVGSQEKGTVTCLNAADGSVKSMFFLPPSKDGSGFGLQVSPCSNYALSVNPVHNNIDVWELSSRTKLHSLKGHGGRPIAAFSPTHALIASASMPVGLWAPIPDFS